MKFRITMKDPDGAYDSIRDAAEEHAKEIPESDLIDREELIEKAHEKLSGIAAKWLEYGEYLCVEIDTEAGTCIVIPKG
jgi:hypothetical protein